MIIKAIRVDSRFIREKIKPEPIRNLSRIRVIRGRNAINPNMIIGDLN